MRSARPGNPVRPHRTSLLIRITLLAAVTATLVACAAAPTGSSSRRAARTNAAPAEQITADARTTIRSRRGFSSAATTPAGAAQLAATDQLADPFAVPGVAERDTRARGINVLKRAFIDPRTGQLSFVGSYDPAYATGEINYVALLHDALRSPAPAFTLEATAESRAAADAFVRYFDQQMEANLASIETGKAWLIGIFDRLLTDPALATDRQRFIKRGAELLGVAPSEVPDMVQVMLNRIHSDSPKFAWFWVHFYQSQGAPELAHWMQAAGAKDNYGLIAAIGELGLEGYRQQIMADIAARRVTQAQGNARLLAAYWKENFRRMRVPESLWRRAADQATARATMSEFQPVVDNVNANLLRERLMEPWLNGLVFSEAFLQRMYRMPPLSVRPECLEGLACDSELARTFLAADWILKTLGTTPELAERVPGHITPSEFAFRLETERQVYDLGDVRTRMWLAPEAVNLRFDPSGSVVSFGESRPAVHAEVTLHRRSGSAAADRVARDAAHGYAAMVTERYDAYARALPELHRLREAAKVLALVRWARSRGIALVPPGPPAPPAPMPAQFQRGFWVANFLANSQRTFFGLAAFGGVDFGRDAGSAWIQAREEPALAATALQQLAGSAALGRDAVDAALGGDLEGARLLADQSARAMTGEFDVRKHPELARIPEVPPPQAVAQSELQSELITRSRAELDALAQGQQMQRQAGSNQLVRSQADAVVAQSREHLQQVRTLLNSGPAAPAETRHWVQLLRNGNWGALPRPTQVATLAAPQSTAASERDELRGRITVLRSELCRASRQITRFSKSIQSDLSQRAQWEQVTNEAYQSALARAKEKLADFSVDYPDGLLSERLGKTTDPAERAKLERALRMVQHLKESYRMRDFATWAANEKIGREEALEGIGIIIETMDVESRIKDYLTKRWGLGQVIAFQEAASDLVTSAYDVTAEVVAWRRLNQLNANSEAFLVATRKSGQRLREVIASIHAAEVRLGLPPGATREICP